ncbi:flagellin [Rhabdaerophilum calidifontis]|uniref:flagellin n=1 Tax=Rhabdaerophilum calidifontis TaxID=2604328 RepID=UPI0014098DA6|nr:flagellin [Rhabdaerophilum calidifontis]
MSVVFNAATAANVTVLQQTNKLFQISQKRVATGKSIFGAADDATKYGMSETMLARAKNINRVNNNISTALKTLESTDLALKQIRNLLSQMNDMATDALNAGSQTTVAATPTANLAETSSVVGASTGHRLSITSDNGKNFTYTFSGATSATTWGQVAQALNNANIGVTMRFEVNGTGSRLVLESTDGKTGFTIDGSSSQQVVDDLTGINSGYDGTYAASRFVNGTSMPTGFGGSNPMGLRFGTGGMLRTASTFAGSSVAAGSSLTFLGADGVARTWSTTTVKNLDAVISEINALNAGVKAEFVQSATGQFRIGLRNLSGNAVTVLNGTGTFDSVSGAARFNAASGVPVVQGNPILGSTNNARRLELGTQYESYKTEITNVINNNVVQAGRNLLRGEGMNVILNEFAANPIQINGVNTSVTGNLALTTLGTAWTTTGNIQTALGEVQTAQSIINTLQAQFGNYASFIQDRYDINAEFATNMKTLGDDLVSADIAEESAKLTALQTQQQFAVQAFSAGSANAQSLLRLLG